MRGWGVLLALLCVAVGHAQFLIAPQGQRAGGVRPTAVEGEMRIHGAYATAILVLTFATQPNWNEEVDFMMRLPDQTEATGFAYWFNDEYVRAKTVEKVRAARIYEFITSRQRDPALIELVGRRQFRVRIAPIDPSKDLRVEIHLAVRAQDGAFALPLRSLFPDSLSSAKLRVVTPNQDGWRNNWGVPWQVGDGKRTAEMASRPWRARSDWRVSLAQPVLITTGRPARGEGTLLLTYTALRDQTNLSLSGGGLKHVFPRRVARLKKGQSVTFAARIPSALGSDTTLAVGGQSYRVGLARLPLPDRGGVVLWGADYVSTLRNADAIRQWGMDLGIPTKETSWLAVPEQEREALETARKALAAQDYWLAVSKFGKSHPTSQRLKARFDDLFRGALREGQTPQDREWDREWSDRRGFDLAVAILGQQYVRAVSAGPTQQRKVVEFERGLDEVIRLGAKYGRSDSGRSFRASLLYGALNSAILAAYDKPTDDGFRDVANVWKVIQKQPHPDFQDNPVQSVWAFRNGLLTSVRLEIGTLRKDSIEKAKQQERTTQRLMLVFGNPRSLRKFARREAALDDIRRYLEDQDVKSRSVPPKERYFPPAPAVRILQLYRVPVPEARPGLTELVASLFTTQESGMPSLELAEVRADGVEWIKVFGLSRLSVIRERFGDSYSWALDSAYRFQFQTMPNRAEEAQAWDKVRAWVRLLQFPMPPRIAPANNPYRNDPRNQFVDAARRFGPTDPATMRARKEMELADQGRPSRVRYRAEILLTQLELDALSQRRLSPEEEHKRAELEARAKALFARMGDPLLIVQAPADATVSARMPDGQLVLLCWNPQRQAWEHRFDVPPGTPEGPLMIPVWIRYGDGRREMRSFPVQVDQTPPTGTVTVTWNGTTPTLHVRTAAEVARVNVVWPDGSRTQLARGSQAGDVVTWHGPGPTQRGTALVILTDRAHNRAELKIELEPELRTGP